MVVGRYTRIFCPKSKHKITILKTIYLKFSQATNPNTVWVKNVEILRDRVQVVIDTFRYRVSMKREMEFSVHKSHEIGTKRYLFICLLNTYIHSQ